ncbi:MAG: thioredoxin family protein [Actinomycetota bacterium]
MNAIGEATRENFRDLVSQGLVLVDVWGPQCRPCLALNPHVERVAEEHSDLKVVKLEAPKARRLCIDLKVMGMPTFLLFREGEEVARISEPNLSPPKLRAWLEEAVRQVSG